MLDRPPSRWLRFLFRSPEVFFSAHLGWLFGGRMVLVHHRGRRSGRSYKTVLEVVQHLEDPPRWFVVAAWGERADWYKNLVADPETRISTGWREVVVTARAIDRVEAIAVHSAYVTEHPLAARAIGKMIGLDLLGGPPDELANRIPVIELRGHVAVDPTRQNYDRIAPYFETVEGIWERKARRAGLAALAPAKGEQILEIGPGTGTSLVANALATGSGGRVIGLDLSRRMCEQSMRRLARSGANGFVVQGDARDLPFESAIFDACFMSFTLELFPEIASVIAGVRRVLAPGGRITVVALSSRGPERMMRRVYNWGHRRFPAFLDCRPIPVSTVLSDASMTVTSSRSLSMWGLPVEVVVAQAPGSRS